MRKQLRYKTQSIIYYFWVRIKIARKNNKKVGFQTRAFNWFPSFPCFGTQNNFPLDSLCLGPGQGKVQVLWRKAKERLASRAGSRPATSAYGDSSTSVFAGTEREHDKTLEINCVTQNTCMRLKLIFSLWSGNPPLLFFSSVCEAIKWIRAGLLPILSLKVYRSSCSLRRQRLLWEWDAVCVRPEWLIGVVGFFHARCSLLTESERQTVPRKDNLFRDGTFFGQSLSIYYVIIGLHLYDGCFWQIAGLFFV